MVAMVMARPEPPVNSYLPPGSAGDGYPSSGSNGSGDQTNLQPPNLPGSFSGNIPSDSYGSPSASSQNAGSQNSPSDSYGPPANNQQQGQFGGSTGINSGRTPSNTYGTPEAANSQRSQNNGQRPSSSYGAPELNTVLGNRNQGPPSTSYGLPTQSQQSSGFGPNSAASPAAPDSQNALLSSKSYGPPGFGSSSGTPSTSYGPPGFGLSGQSENNFNNQGTRPQGTPTGTPSNTYGTPALSQDNSFNSPSNSYGLPSTSSRTSGNGSNRGSLSSPSNSYGPPTQGTDSYNSASRDLQSGRQNKVPSDSYGPPDQQNGQNSRNSGFKANAFNQNDQSGGNIYPPNGNEGISNGFGNNGNTGNNGYTGSNGNTGSNNDQSNVSK